MKVNKGKVLLWVIILMIWCSAFIVATYSVGQHYGKNVATQQFEQDTTAYKELKTQRAVERTLNFVSIVGGIFFVYMIGKQFKFPEEKSDS